MEHQDESNELFQAGMREQRTSLDAEKSRGVHPPRTVAEENEQMTSEGPDGHRLRDPLKAAEMQRQEYGDARGDGALMATSQRANGLEVETEDLGTAEPGRQRQGTDVKSGPSRNG